MPDNSTKQKKNVRVLLQNVRISFPHLDEPHASTAIPGAPEKYSASFLMEPGSPAHTACAKAIQDVAESTWGRAYAAQLANPTSDKQPLHRGDDRPKVYDGYAGMMYVSASSRVQPDLRDADPKVQIRDAQAIREKFLPGYRVNAYVEFWPETRFSQRVCASLVGVQFAGYADVLGGAAVQACDFPDVSAQAAASASAFPAADADIPF